MRIRLIALPILLILTVLRAGGENIRGLVVDEVHVKPQTDYERTVEISLEEMAAIYVEENTRFLEALRIELLLSNRLKKYFNSFGLAIHKQVSPPPQPGLQSFSGKRAFFHYLPYLNRIYINIPVSGGLQEISPIPAGTFFLDEPVQTDEFPILISIIPIMKGIPNSIINSKFFLTIRPIIARRGLLKLSVHHPPGKEDEPVELFIDEQQITDPGALLEIESGIHHLQVKSTAFKEVNASFTIESGKTSKVEILLEEIACRLYIEAPQGAEVYLDGEKLVDYAGSRYQLSEGSHIVRIKVGDYSLSKRFLTKSGKDYHISCVFDIIISED